MDSQQVINCQACNQGIVDQFYVNEQGGYCPKCKEEIFDRKLGFKGYVPSFLFGLLGAV